MTDRERHGVTRPAAVLVGGVLLALVAGGAAHLVFGSGSEWRGLWAAVTIALALVTIALAVLSARADRRTEELRHRRREELDEARKNAREARRKARDLLAREGRDAPAG